MLLLERGVYYLQGREGRETKEQHELTLVNEWGCVGLMSEGK